MTQKTSVNGGLNLSLLVNAATVTLKGGKQAHNLVNYIELHIL